MLADRMRLAAGAAGLAVPDTPGVEFMGGYYVGIIDTTRDNIIAADQYQDGLRYALIVSPQDLEGGRDTGTDDLQWRTSQATVQEAQTRWDGLAAQRALASATYPAFNYCAGLSVPSDDASEWYLPAVDELELLYRMLKPTTTANQTGTRDAGTFPGGGSTAWTYGVNPSSDPAGAAYTSGDPARTAVADFQDGGPQALDPGYFYWSASWYSSSNAWGQFADTGSQYGVNQTILSRRVRPVRRLVL